MKKKYTGWVKEAEEYDLLQEVYFVMNFIINISIIYNSQNRTQYRSLGEDYNKLGLVYDEAIQNDTAKKHTIMLQHLQGNGSRRFCGYQRPQVLESLI